ncbi:MAG: DUF507 family protein [Nitrospirae bacterium]|nr:DUF507 family protein [Nitrospirota bacterium]MBI3593954.1 DUF507 family protein [Nitrospirota bacterium]
MILSDEKISSLTHLILESLIEKKWATLLQEESRVLREIRKMIASELRVQEEIDLLVRQKLASYARRPVEGSPEWDILYRKFFNEEKMKKQR